MKTEQVFDIPAMLHKDSVSDELFAHFAAFVGQVTSQRYIFLSKAESIVVEEDSYEKNVIPPNVSAIYVRIASADSFVEVKNRSVFKNFGEVSDKSLNSITVQGPNPVAVRGLRMKIEQTVGPQRFLLRTVFYRYALTWFWSTLIILWFAEYRLLKVLRPGVSLSSPLSVLSAILLLSIALGTALFYAKWSLPLFTFWFPYFEIEGNLSDYRVKGQRFVGAVWISILASGIYNLFSLLVGTGK